MSSLMRAWRCAWRGGPDDRALPCPAVPSRRAQPASSPPGAWPGALPVDDAVLCVDELVANAVQHSRSGLPGGTVEVRIAVAAGEWLRVEVQDAGPSRLRCPRRGVRLTSAAGAWPSS